LNDTPPDFTPILTLIRDAQGRALQRVNRELIDLYWQIGAYLHARIEADGWGRGTVRQLADWLAQEHPQARGFSASNLWRMGQFYDTYRGNPVLATVLRELGWSHHMTIIGRAQSEQEREFYLQAAMHQQHPIAPHLFRDSYLLDFLNLPPAHKPAARPGHAPETLPDGTRPGLHVRGRGVSRAGRHAGLLQRSAAVPPQPSGAGGVRTENHALHARHAGQLDFYLEALDSNHRKPHENPSIGVLLCRSADEQVVEYALARSASPALVARYLTALPDKALLQAKLNEFYTLEEGLKDDE